MPSLPSSPGPATTSGVTCTDASAFTQGSSQTSSSASLFPSVIPPDHPTRTLVLCFDGTGDQFDADNSNVVQFFSMLKKDDRRQQMVYYQAGIGTYTNPQIATPFTAKLAKTLDAMIACNLDAHVMDGYEFLMQNYKSGDKICIFGFSRGAHTARALAGMVHKVGLLPAGNHQQVPFAYKMFTRTDATGWAQSTAFKKAFSMDVDIEFIGVWDTVCSVGLIPRRLPFTTSNTAVKTFRHAISLDERRAKFRANLFNRPTPTEQGLGTQMGDMPKAGSVNDIQGLKGYNGLGNPRKAGKKGYKKRKSRRHEPEQPEMERRFSMMEPQLETDVLEVWFAGCHCDVGGGSVPNDTRHSLARIPLRWMIRQCFETNTGIRFHSELLRTVGLDPRSLYPIVAPRPPLVTVPETTTPMQEDYKKTLSWRVKTLKFTPLLDPPASPLDEKADGAPTRSRFSGISVRTDTATSSAISPGTLTEEEEDLNDALSPIYDQLLLKRIWWALELWPMRHRVQNDDASWESKIMLNLGRGRKASKHAKHPGIHVHRTVKIRMDAEAHLIEDAHGRKYIPRAKFEHEPIWVD